jgi:alpha-methylacyl-CoA racemase
VPGPLAGVRVVELAGIGPAPLACRLLSDYGADVVRITRPGEKGAGADHLGRDRPFLGLDLKSTDGLARLRELVAVADVFVDCYRPGVTERLGIGPDDLLAENPRLVYARMTGWGQTGPLRLGAGHDINYLAVTGALAVIGEHGGAPVPPHNFLADYGGGTMFLLSGVLAALVERQASGQGQVIDVAMVDGASYFLTYIQDELTQGRWVQERGSNDLDTGRPWYATYRCADGEYVAVGCIEEHFFALMLQMLGLDRPQGQGDPATWPALRAELAATFATRTRDEWAALFAGTDACVSPVLWPDEARSHAQAVEREAFIKDEPGPAPRFSRTPPQRTYDEDGDALVARWRTA